MKLLAVCLGTMMLLTACAWRATYLSEVVNSATQDNVAKKLGPPHATHKLDNGETVWQYRHYRSSYVEGTGGSRCREYILTFDPQRILRSWTRQRC